MFTKRIQQLEPSPTFVLDAKVKQMQKEGIDVINLGIGEPDFNTPKHIGDAAIQAIHDGFTHYTATSGIQELREAIAHKFQNDNGIVYRPEQIIVGSGSKPLLYIAFQVLCEQGDDVLVPVPTWSSYVEQIKLAGAKPVFIPLESPFKLTAELVRKYITSRTKVLLLNTPSNPTGAVIDPAELKKIAELAVERDIWVIVDEMYEKILYEGMHVSIASLGSDIYKRTVTVNGFSKTYAMTGWRLGYAGGNLEVIKAMSDLQGQLTANASSISQKAGVAALTGETGPIDDMINEFKKRRDYLVSALSSIPELEVVAPEGGFFFFVGIHKLLGKDYENSRKWCEGLLQRKKVAVIAGEAFFVSGYFRLSFASPLEKLYTAVEKIKEFIDEC